MSVHSLSKKISKMKVRKTCTEGVIAQAKSFRGLSKAKFRGKKKVEMRLLLTAAVTNLEKVLAKVKRIRVDSALSRIKRPYTSFIENLSRFFFDYFFGKVMFFPITPLHTVWQHAQFFT